MKEDKKCQKCNNRIIKSRKETAKMITLISDFLAFSLRVDKYRNPIDPLSNIKDFIKFENLYTHEQDAIMFIVKHQKRRTKGFSCNGWTFSYIKNQGLFKL